MLMLQEKMRRIRLDSFLPRSRRKRIVIRRGLTLVELVVTVGIVSFLAVALGASCVKLITIQEREREEGYIREQLTDICGVYADYLSIGSSLTNAVDRFDVMYRIETGGVSLETGRVTTSRVARVSQLISSVKSSGDANRKTLDLDVLGFEPGILTNKFSRSLCGADTPLVSLEQIRELKLKDNVVNLSCRLDKLNESESLWYLRVVATYELETEKEGRDPHRIVSSGRIVRLWNRE